MKRPRAPLHSFLVHRDRCGDFLLPRGMPPAVASRPQLEQLVAEMLGFSCCRAA